jgi:hypothetical protein
MPLPLSWRFLRQTSASAEACPAPRVAAEVVQLTRWVKVEIRFCAPLSLPAVYEQRDAPRR